MDFDIAVRDWKPNTNDLFKWRPCAYFSESSTRAWPRSYMAAFSVTSNFIFAHHSESSSIAGSKNVKHGQPPSRKIVVDTAPWFDNFIQQGIKSCIDYKTSLFFVQFDIVNSSEHQTWISILWNSHKMYMATAPPNWIIPKSFSRRSKWLLVSKVDTGLQEYGDQGFV